MKYKITGTIFLISLLIILNSCSSLPEWVIRRGPNKISFPQKNLDDTQKKLVEGALYLKGRNKINIKNRKFNMDCTGTVLGVYYYAGIDLSKEFNKYTGPGVKRLYNSLNQKKLLYNTNAPKPGDIIFWDNTWDRNHDGKENDYLSHVGMVVKSEKNGQITYIHEHYKKGIIFEKMNLKNPNTYKKVINGKSIIINSPMRMKGSKKHSKWLSSHLYKIFGKAYLVNSQEEK